MNRLLLLVLMGVVMVGCAPDCRTAQSCLDEYYKTSNNTMYKHAILSQRAACYERFGDGAKECE